MIIYDSWVHHEDEDEEMMYTKAAFGQPSILYGGNNAPGAPNPLMPEGFLTVFEPSEFQPLWDRIRELKAAREPIVVRRNVTVVDNKHFGIKGGRKVDIIFVISLPIDSFRDALPEETKAHLPDYFPNMDSDELLAKFHLGAIAQYASYLTKTAVVDQARAMLNGEPVPPLPPPSPSPPTPPTPSPSPSPSPQPMGRCLDQTTQDTCKLTSQAGHGQCVWCYIGGSINVCSPKDDCISHHGKPTLI